MAPWVFFAAAAWAGLQPAREPLPAREVERPIVLPRGWTEVGGDAAATGVEVSGRHGVARGLAVSAAVTSAPELVGARIGLDVGLVWREPPALAWSAEVAWVQPWSRAAGTAEGRLRIRRAFGPFRADASGGLGLTGSALAPLADAALLLQAGPLWVEGRVALADDARTERTGAMVFQASRGVSIGAFLRLDAPGAGARIRVWL